MADNIKQFIRNFKALQKQSAFAASRAINATAKDVRKHVVEVTWPRSVNVRNRRFMTAALRTKFSTKRRLIATIFDRLGRASLLLHTDGGTKFAKGGTLAVPQGVRRTGSGKIGKAKQPANIRNSFRANLRGMGDAIYQRQGKGGRRLKLMYVLERSVRMRRRFPFFRDAKKVVNRKFGRHFAREFKNAIRTAR